MRLKIASVMLLAGTVVGCASNPPPPPPPMPEPMPAPMPAPAVMAPMSGTYRGTAELAGGGRGCFAPRGTVLARVRGTVISVASMRGRINPDGTVSGRGLSGTVNGGNADLTVMRGRCSYHYTLSNGSTTLNNGSVITGNGATGPAMQPGDTGSAQAPQPAQSLPQ